MTDFIMNVDEHHCTLRGACAAESFFTRESDGVKGAHYTKRVTGNIEESTEAIPSEQIKEGTRKLIIKAFSFTLILKLSSSFLF